jgi:biotin synthase-related radical SAM superfamily protein
LKELINSKSSKELVVEAEEVNLEVNMKMALMTKGCLGKTQPQPSEKKMKNQTNTKVHLKKSGEKVLRKGMMVAHFHLLESKRSNLL